VAIVAFFGGLALYLGPVARLVVLWLCLGTPALTTLMVAECMVALVHGLHPVRAGAWFAPRPHDEDGLPSRIVSLEFATAAATALVLLATGPLWQPAMGIAVPAWVIAQVALRHAGQSAMAALAGKRRLFAMFAALVDITVVLPVVAIVGRSLEAAVFVSTTLTIMFLILAAYSPSVTLANDTKETVVVDRWQIGTWLRGASRDLWRPVMALVAGASALIPFSASLVILSALSVPFMAIATTKPSPDPFRRLMRSWICTALSLALVYHAGPALFRLVFPKSFGDGAWLQTLAWSALAFVPMTMRAERVPPSERSRAIAAVLATAMLVTLAVTAGTEGVLLAVALSALVRALVAAAVR